DDLRRSRAHVDLPHDSPSGPARAAEHDGLPDSHHRLADVLVALSDGTEWPDAVRRSQRQPNGRQRPDSAAMDSEYQHGLHRARRAGVRGALYPDARARVENRHPETICGVAPPDGGRLFHSHTWNQIGRARWQERVHLAIPELRAAEHR